MPLPRGKDVPSGRTGNYDRRRLEVCLFRKLAALTVLFWGHAGIAKPLAAFGLCHCALALRTSRTPAHLSYPGLDHRTKCGFRERLSS